MPEQQQTIATVAACVEQNERPPATASSIRIKTPRRILHFSDGTLEEYSTDDEPDTLAANQTNQQNQVDIKHLTWGPWMIHQAYNSSSRVLSACDFVGEKFASFLGITTPKYDYEIEHFKKIQQEKENEKKEQLETGGWMQATIESQQPPNVNSGGVQYVITQEDLQKKC